MGARSRGGRGGRYTLGSPDDGRSRRSLAGKIAHGRCGARRTPLDEPVRRLALVLISGLKARGRAMAIRRAAAALVMLTVATAGPAAADDLLLLGFAAPAIECFSSDTELEASRCPAGSFPFPQTVQERNFRVRATSREGREWWVRRGDAVVSTSARELRPLRRNGPGARASRANQEARGAGVSSVPPIVFSERTIARLPICSRTLGSLSVEGLDEGAQYDGAAALVEQMARTSGCFTFIGTPGGGSSSLVERDNDSGSEEVFDVRFQVGVVVSSNFLDESYIEICRSVPNAVGCERPRARILVSRGSTASFFDYGVPVAYDAPIGVAWAPDSETAFVELYRDIVRTRSRQFPDDHAPTFPP